MARKETYVMVLRGGKQPSSLLFNVGGEGESTTLLKLKGRKTGLIFSEIVSVLSRYGAVSPLKTSEREEIFAIREDLGPIIGGFLILLRRSRSPKSWLSLLGDVLEGKYPILTTAFESYLTMAFDMSRFDKAYGGRRRQTLTPAVLDASSTALKAFVKSILKSREKNLIPS